MAVNHGFFSGCFWASVYPSSDSSSKESSWGFIFYFGIMLTFVFRIEDVSPISVLISSSFFAIVFSRLWCFSLSLPMYSKFGVNFPFKVIIALFSSGIRVCYSMASLLSLLTMSGTHSFSRWLNSIAYVKHQSTCVVGEFTGQKVDRQVHELTVLVMVVESLLLLQGIKVKEGPFWLGVLLQALNRPVKIAADLN